MTTQAEQPPLLDGGIYTHCMICGRALSNPVSKIRGMGPVCAARYPRENEVLDQESRMVVLTDPPLHEALAIRRLEDGRVATNVPWILIDHSPTGFEFGYGGSGPADLALNIAHQAILGLLPQAKHNVVALFGPKGDFKQTCSREAYAIHQDLKWHFIAPLDQNGAHLIPWSGIEEFCKKALTERMEEPTQATF